MDTLPLRPNVCMLVLNKDNKLFLGERYGCPGVWQFPQGGAKEKYSLEENVIKELHEELGAERELFTILQKLDAQHEYKFDSTPDYFADKWSGQKQTFWLVRFSGSDSDLNFNRYKPEFMDCKWCSMQEIRELAEPKRLHGYEKAFKEIEDKGLIASKEG